MKSFVVVVGVLLGACTIVDTAKQEPNWPMLQIQKHVVSNDEMLKRCLSYNTSVFASPMACSTWDLKAKTCDIWLSTSMDWVFLLEHEILHCLGFLKHK